jgi:ABC-2 type transport system ATP-binding protein
MIRTSALTKRFGSVLAVDGIDLDVRAGDRFGFLGPNGSGKTTTVRMILGLVYPTSGEIEVLGKPAPKQLSSVLPMIGALVEGPAAYPHLSGRANLAIMDAAGSGGRRRTRKKRVGEVLERVGLGGVDRRPVKAYSLGMRQRLGLAAALLRAPKLLVLDEPTNGLDPRGIAEIRDLLIDLNKAGTTVFLSSHLLAEVDQLCTRVGIVDRGRLVLQDELDTVRRPTGRVIVESPDAAEIVGQLNGQVTGRDGARVVIRHDDPAELNAMLVGKGFRIERLAPERRTLEDVVFEVTGAGSDRVAGSGGVTGVDRVAASDRAAGSGGVAGPGSERSDA